MANMLATPVRDVLTMKLSEFRKWRAAAEDVAAALGQLPKT